MRQLVLGESLEVLIDHRGKTPKKLGSEFAEEGVPVASALLVNDGALDLSRARYVSADTFQRWMPIRTREGDVLLTSEAPLGRVARVPSDEPLVLGQRLFGLRGAAGVLDNGYLFYSLQTKGVLADLLGRSTGSTVTGIRQSALRAVRIPAPEIAEQRAIAEVLGALDDKIAANTKLASSADEFIRSQFAALRPESTQALNELSVQRRTSVKPYAIDPETPYIGLEHLPRRSVWLAEAGVASAVTSGKSEFRTGDILFGKLRPYFHKIVAADRDGVCSTDIIVLTPKRPEFAGFVLAAASSEAVVQAVTASSGGTRMPRTNWADLSEVEIPWPGDIAALSFSERIEPLANSVQALLRENRTLAATRDTLLPQLMSGKLRVKDAEKLNTEVV